MNAHKEGYVAYHAMKEFNELTPANPYNRVTQRNQRSAWEAGFFDAEQSYDEEDAKSELIGEQE